MTKPVLVINIYQDAFDDGNPRDEFENVGTLYTWHNRYTLGGKKDENHQTKPDNVIFWIFDTFQLYHEIEELEDYDIADGYLYIKNESGEWIDPSYAETGRFHDFVKSWMENNLCLLPVYMYDHSGITISTQPFSCRWDSGQVGFIYVTKETCERINESFENAENILKAEIAMLDQYLTGDVWCADVTLCSGEILDDEEESLEHLCESGFSYEDDIVQIYTSEHVPNSIYILDEDSCCGIYGHNSALEYGVDMAKSLVKYSKKLPENPNQLEISYETT